MTQETRRTFELLLSDCTEQLEDAIAMLSESLQYCRTRNHLAALAATETVEQNIAYVKVVLQRLARKWPGQQV